MRDPVTISSLSILGGFHVFLMNRGPDLVNTANQEPHWEEVLHGEGAC